MKYGRGHIADPIHHRRVGIRHLFARHSGSMITPGQNADLSPHLPPYANQVSTSSCVGHGIGEAVYCALGARSTPLPWVPSYKGIYDNGRCIDRAIRTDGKLPPLVDEGSMPNQGWRGVSEWGVRKMIPIADRGSDVDPSTINDEPKLGELEAESATLLVGYYAIESFGDERVENIRAALANGFPVTFATFVDTAFEEWDGSSPLGMPDVNDKNGGGHYLCAFGYRTDANGRTILRFRNSWGTDWGMGGDGEGTEAFMAQISDVYAASVRLVTP